MMGLAKFAYHPFSVSRTPTGSKTCAKALDAYVDNLHNNPHHFLFQSWT